MEPKPRLLTILDAVTAVLFVLATGMVFFYAPTEAVMGQVQRCSTTMWRQLGGYAKLWGCCACRYRLSTHRPAATGISSASPQ